MQAVLRRTDRVQVIWGTRDAPGHVFTRAAYRLEVVGEGVFVESTHEVEINSDELKLRLDTGHRNEDARFRHREHACRVASGADARNDRHRWLSDRERL